MTAGQRRNTFRNVILADKQCSSTAELQKGEARVGIRDEGRRRIPTPRLIPPHEVIKVQHNACDVLEKAFDRNETEMASDWLIRCLFDLAQLWQCGDLWAITQIVRGKRDLSVQIVGIAGKYDPALLEAIEIWSRSVGCARVYGTGRRGWLRLLSDYKAVSITLCKEL